MPPIPPTITPSLQNWTIVPVANPEQSQAEEFQLILSGMASLDVLGVPGVSSRNEVFVIIPDVAPALMYAIETYPTVTPPPGAAVFHVEQWAVFVVVGAARDAGTGAALTGFAVDAWQLYRPTNAANPIFAGIEVGASVFNNNGNAAVASFSYNVTLVGTIGHAGVATQ